MDLKAAKKLFETGTGCSATFWALWSDFSELLLGTYSSTISMGGTGTTFGYSSTTGAF